MKFKNIIIILVLSYATTSCKTLNLFESATTPTASEIERVDSVFYGQKSSQYRIRVDDKITISIWGQDEWSVGSTYGVYNSNEVYGKWLMVDADGNIEIPKMGTMNVLDKTILELKREVQHSFSTWVQNPIVDVKILNREITVMGEVRDPQVIIVDKEQNRLLDLIARCKGFEFYANLRCIKILRQVGRDVYVANIDLTKPDYRNLELNILPGDVVVVPSRSFRDFDRRISIIIPFTTTITAAGIFLNKL